MTETTATAADAPAVVSTPEFRPPPAAPTEAASDGAPVDGSPEDGRPAVSVIIPVRNGAQWLEEQLGALAKQECASDWEIVVADNGSTDGSADVVGRWTDQFSAIRLVDASSQPGAPGARNAGVRASDGDLLAFCDADDVVHPGWVAACAGALARADVAAGFFDFWSLNGLPASPPVPAAIRQLGFLPAGLGANLAVRRQAFEEIGGFDVRLLAGEDIDLCWRLQLRGYRFVPAPQAVVAKRERQEFRQVFRHALVYGISGPVLYKRHRRAGARRNLVGAVKSWGWLVISTPSLRSSENRIAWARTAGMRIGRLLGSLRQGVFFP